MRLKIIGIMCVLNLVSSCHQGTLDDSEDKWQLKNIINYKDNKQKFKYWAIVGSPTWGCSTFFHYSNNSLDDAMTPALADCNRKCGKNDCYVIDTYISNEVPESLTNTNADDNPDALENYYNRLMSEENTKSTQSIDLDSAKTECEDLGFKKGTEKFGECVLKLSE